jgi:hypothetical protein
MKLEAEYFSETSVNYQTLQRYFPEDITIRNHGHENLKANIP